MPHKVGELVLGGFGLGMITKKEIYGDYHVEWYCPQKDSLRTRFLYEEIKEMKEDLWEYKRTKSVMQ